MIPPSSSLRRRAGTRTASAERSKELVRIVVYMLSKASLLRGFFISNPLIFFRYRNSDNEVTMYDEFEGF